MKKVIGHIQSPLLANIPVKEFADAELNEILANTKQSIVLDINQLDLSVKGVLADKSGIAERGYNYPGQFEITYFTLGWNNLLIGNSGNIGINERNKSCAA